MNYQLSKDFEEDTPCIECKHFKRMNLNYGICILNPPQIVYTLSLKYFIIPIIKYEFIYPIFHVHTIGCSKFKY